MEKFYGNYLGICINNNDPDYRGRVQIFIPHIMPALYEGWNKEGIDKKIECIGDNLKNSLTKAEVDQLKLMLPWAEAASPVFGNSAPGHYNPQSGQFNPTYGTENQVVAAASTSGSYRSLDSIPIADPGVKGIRGNNPGNLHTVGSPYIGQVGTGSDIGGDVAFFDTLGNGIAQNLNQIALNISRGQNTISSMAGGWTGTSGGTAAAVAQTWSTYSGIGVNEPLNFNNKAQMQALLQGISFNESSGVAPNFQAGFNEGWNILKGRKPGLWTGPEVTSSNNGASIPNDPTASPLPGSTSPAQYNPHNTFESPVHLSIYGAQEAVQSTSATTQSVTEGSPGAPVPGGSKNAFSFNAATSRSGGLVKNGVTYCLRGTCNIAGYLTGNTAWYGSAGITGANEVNKVDDKLTGVAAYGPGKGQVLYKNEGTIQGTTYQAQQGDVIIHQVGLGRLGKTYGHAQIFVNGQWHSFKTEGNTLGSYLNLNGQQSTLFRLTPEGQKAMLELGLADTTQLGVPYEGTAPITTDPVSGDINNGPEFDGRVARNPTTIQPTVTDTTGMPQGMFSVPNPGAMLWVFFREGDPLYPVYFAASFGAREWKNAYKATSQGGHYPGKDDTTPRNAALIAPSLAGGMSFVDTKTDDQDCRSVRIFHANGGHLEFHVHGSTLYQPNEHIQQVAGNAYNSCLNREDWTQGTNNSVTIGDRITIVGNMSQEALDIIEQHAQIVKDINKNMLKNGGGSSSGSGTSGNQEQSSTSNNTTFFYDNLVSGVITPGEAALMKTGINVVDVTTPTNPKINNETVTPTVYQGSTLNATQQQNLGPALTQ